MQVEENIYYTLRRMIPGGVNSPANAFIGMGVDPFVVKEAYRDILISTDGRQFCDFCCSWGALIHGHAHPLIIEAVKDQLYKGTTYGLSGESVFSLAHTIMEHLPSMEMLRFVSSGTEATSATVRLARGFTQREFIVKCIGNYHGHSDQFLTKAGSSVASLPEASSQGIPNGAIANTISIPFNDSEVLEELFSMKEYKGRIAAVIVEPIAGNMGVVPAKPAFLHALRKHTEQEGALLIFDEVITGFRADLNGAQSLYGITPDLTCLGKIIGGGFPAAAFGGKKEIMLQLAPCGPIFQAGTLSGNPVAMTAGFHALKLLEVDGVYEELERKTNLFTKTVGSYLKQNVLPHTIQQQGSMFTLFFGKSVINSFDDVKTLDLDLFASYFRYMLDKGFYIPPSQYEAWFVSTVHQDQHIQEAAEATINFFETLQK
ncbi:MAG: glutamate-1-semialdehyde 2,1-aminomutase [Chlamydiales bacterium]